MSPEDANDGASERQVVVDPTPVPGVNSAGFRNVSLQLKRPDLLEFRPSAAGRTMGVAFLLLAAFLAIPTIAWGLPSLEHFRVNPKLAGLCSLSLFGSVAAHGMSLYALLLGGRRFQFDRTSGWLSRGIVRSRRIRQLEEIVAVQLVFGGTKVALGKTRPFKTYQLILIFADPLAGRGEPGEALRKTLIDSIGFRSLNPRIGLCQHPDMNWMREAGLQLAEFLGVRLIDGIS